jgi:insertion element IS1 protein InsB
LRDGVSLKRKFLGIDRSAKIITMNCPKSDSNNLRKNGHRRGKQNSQCKNCDRQFIDHYSAVGYSQQVQQECLTMYLNGNGFRAIERITQVNHNTVIRWVKQAANQIPAH